MTLGRVQRPARGLPDGHRSGNEPHLEERHERRRHQDHRDLALPERDERRGAREAHLGQHVRRHDARRREPVPPDRPHGTHPLGGRPLRQRRLARHAARSDRERRAASASSRTACRRRTTSFALASRSGGTRRARRTRNFRSASRSCETSRSRARRAPHGAGVTAYNPPVNLGRPRHLRGRDRLPPVHRVHEEVEAAMSAAHSLPLIDRALRMVEQGARDPLRAVKMRRRARARAARAPRRERARAASGAAPLERAGSTSRSPRSAARTSFASRAIDPSGHRRGNTTTPTLKVEWPGGRGVMRSIYAGTSDGASREPLVPSRFASR